MVKMGSIVKNLSNARDYILKQNKQSLKVHTAKAKLIKELAKLFSKVEFIEYGWTTFQHKDYSNNDISFDESWKQTEYVFDLLARNGYEPEVKKNFYGYGDNPKWYWTIIVPLEGFDRRDYNLYIRMGWAEPDNDCVPMQQASVSKVWVCKK